MTASLPLVTPNPGIHSIPSTGASATPQDALGVVTQATGISTGVGGDVATALTGAGGMGNPFASIAAFGQAALSAISDIGQLIIQLGEEAITGVVDIIKAAIQGVGDIINAILSAFTGGGFGGGGTANDALGAMTATQATIQATSTAVQALQNRDAADSNNGTNVWVDFSTYATAVSLSGFSQVDSGPALGITGGYAALQGSGAASDFAIYDGAQTLTDYQLVNAIFQTAPSNLNAHHVLIGRANASLTTFFYATVSWFGVTMHNVVSGVDTVVDSLPFTVEQFYAGAPYSLRCGIEGSPGTYEVLVNGASLFSWVDTSNVTNIGALYRYCGFGLFQASGGKAGNVAAFGFADNAPGALIGDMFRAYSTDATPIAVPNAISSQLFPASYFDSTELASSNYTYDPSTNTLTVAAAGIYMVEVSTQWVANTVDTFVYFAAALFKNGSLYRQGDTPAQANPGAAPFFSVGSETFIVQLNAGDIIQPGFFSYATPTGDKSSIAGDPAAELTIFSCALLNTGTAAT